MDEDRIRRGAIIAIPIFFLLSLWLPAAGTCLEDGRTHEEATSLIWMMMGWLGPFVGLFGWYANPMLFYCWIRLVFWRSPGWIAAVATVLLGLSSFVHARFNYVDSPENYHLCHWGWGIAFWLAALSAPLLAKVMTASMASSRSSLDPGRNPQL